MRKKHSKCILFFAIIIFIIASGLVYYQEVFQVVFYPFAKQIEKVRLLKYVEGYKTLETEHFVIRYKNEDEEYAKLTGKIGDKYYEDICNLFEYYPSKKSDVIIYRDEKSLLENLRFDHSNTPIGVYYSGIINILSPIIWIKDIENLEQTYELNGPIVHEFTHLLVDEITNGNYPMWLTEGLALYTEYEITGFEWNRYNMYEDKITIKKLDENFDAIDQVAAYRKSFEVVRWMSETWGFEKTRNILQILGRGSSINKTVKTVLKIDLYDLKNL